MKLLFENWRKYLKEGMVTLEKWPTGYTIGIIKDPKFTKDAYGIKLYDEHGWDVGYCNVEKVDIKPSSPQDTDEDRCDNTLFHNLYTFHVRVDPEERGFGPFLADLALELAYIDGKMIIPAKLVGGAGTEGAKRLYDYYLDNRNDVEKIKIDPDCWEYYSSTPPPQDTPESFLYLYRKKPAILNSKLAKEVITIK